MSLISILKYLLLVSAITHVVSAEGPDIPLGLCDIDEFPCHDGQSCIALGKQCDEYADCPDGSDELDCDFKSECDEYDFKCNDGTCLADGQKCDGYKDCPDGEDELPENCPKCDGFKCQNGKCISNDKRCNHYKDCPKGDDEENCEEACKKDEWQCDHGQCIPIEKRCNGNIDCADDISDERHCDILDACMPDEYTCKSGVCIPELSVCDNHVDCPDGDDEDESCDCARNEFKCIKGGGCIDMKRKCDGVDDCRDHSDENNCNGPLVCLDTEFSCDNGTCYPLMYKCDGFKDCNDNTDEVGCPSACTKDQFQCGGTRECIDLKDRCNGIIDCSDESDERDCESCVAGAFHCEESLECLRASQKCDNVVDCRDRTDEEDCSAEPAECSASEWRCANGECIDRNEYCDNFSDCTDGSDEANCPQEATTLAPPLPFDCAATEWRCASGECIDRNEYCDNYPDCRDGSDEADCNQEVTTLLPSQVECAANEWQCADGTQCIDEREYCNGYLDCNDQSDEDNCLREATTVRPRCAENEWQCDNGQCIYGMYYCDKRVDCSDGSDERNCTIFDGRQCEDDEFYCNGQCIEGFRKCDGYTDCPDRSDELNCPPRPRPTTPAPCPEYTCNDGSCYSSSQVCDGYPDCSSQEDELDCPTQCNDQQFTCADGSCVPLNARCNRRVDCRDGSDETSCPCRANEFQCRTGECILKGRRCDQRVDCRDGSDEDVQECGTESPDVCHGKFRCENGPCIDQNLRCNGRVDCPFDISDELDCPKMLDQREPARLNLKTYPNEQTIKESREVVFQCRDEGPIRARVQWTRNGRSLPPGTRDINGRLEIPNIRVEHSGEYVCKAIGYPASTAGSQVSVHLTVEKSSPTFFPDVIGCKENEATCMNGQCISKNQICNGVFDCTDGSDENSCSSLGKCEPNEFKCSNRKCVLKTWRCDGEDDCGDGSDETNCQKSGDGSCRYDEFECQNRQCIPKSFQCDSQPDCMDNSDEIGCTSPAVIQGPPPMVTLAPGSVFNITCRATGVPVPLIVWRLNWGHVPDKCVSSSENGYGVLTCFNIQPIDAGAYSCEIINSMGTHFVSPDTILIVRGSESPCSLGYFNTKAVRSEDCISCFCFGVSTKCSSADLFTYQLRPPVVSTQLVGVEGPWSGSREVRINKNQNYNNLLALRHGVQLRLSDVPASSDYLYYQLPNEYNNNQLKSYGGYISYDVEFSGSGTPNNAPDIIIQGNGYTLTYRYPTRLLSNTKNSVKAQIFANNWFKPDGSYATREEIMMSIADIENILIKLQYVDGGERNVELVNVVMDSAAIRDFGLGSASLVEQCSCPEGYTGLSCESCAVGFVRQKIGPWLGRCVKDVEPCRPGYYGDPARGISCRPCPCPVPGNSRATTCTLDRNNRVLCHCDTGYVGPRCEECAPGYTGNPSTYGCNPIPVSGCDQYGTERVSSNGSCICKSDVEGRMCDRCSPGSYYLNPNGCTNCFCMGVSDNCTSSSLTRTTIKSSFVSSTAQGYNLVSGYEEPKEIYSNFEFANQEMLYRNFGPSDDTYYWRLPATFLGNKLESYGGNITYTLRYKPQPSGSASKSSSPDIVIESGNKIMLHHYRTDSILPSDSNTYTVPVIETYWQHYEDGTEANRQHLLMALANVENIYIKATYTTVAQEAALSFVSLDTATDAPSGYGQRAIEVEVCTCPPGHQGLSCEDCSPGYYKGDSGLYLRLCEPCECNGHSDECDPKTGVCRNCRDNTRGDYCDECIEGYEGDPTTGDRYACRRISTQPGPITRCTDCSQLGTMACYDNSCVCKPNVEGLLCDQCREGTFGLSESSKEGCLSCFCSGATASCSAGVYYKEQIPILIFDGSDDTFSITDRYKSQESLTGFEYDIGRNEISYAFADDSKTFYWNLPEKLTGNKILSYGGNLNITQRTDGNGEYVQDQDVILRGNHRVLVWSRKDLSEENYSVKLVETDWQSMQETGPRPVSRDEFLSVLANLENILVRASLREFTRESSISDIILDTAVRQRTNQEMMNQIEVCRCPAGYTGTSCERCDNMYYRDPYDRSAGIAGACKRCPCANAESCALGAGRRIVCNCLPGYEGETCQLRERPTRPPFVPPAPRPPTIAVQITSPSLKIVEIGETTDFSCSGYYIIDSSPLLIKWYKLNGTLSNRAYAKSGVLYIRNAQIDDSGIYVCQAQIGSEIVRENVTLTVGGSPQSPQVTLDQAVIEKDEYESADVYCTAVGNPKPQIYWDRIDGTMPTDVQIYEGLLRFNSLRKSDEGSYRCYAQNSVGHNDQILTIYVRSRQPTVESIYITPDSYDSAPGEEVRIQCVTQPRAKVTWSKLGSPELPRNVLVRGEEIIIQYSTVDDAGRYQCSAQFPSGVVRSGQVEVRISPRVSQTEPVIREFERKYTVQQGNDFSLTCEATGSPYPKVEWQMHNQQFAANAQQTGNVLRILNARPENNGVYICLASNTIGSDQKATIIEIEQREAPVIELYPKEPQKIRVGESTRFTCRIISGAPYPTLSWVRKDGLSLSSRITEDYPGVITLREASLDDAGQYECRAENAAGVTSMTTNLEIQESPVITLYPNLTQLAVTEGDEINIQCTATGKPSPTVEFKYPQAARLPSSSVSDSFSQLSQAFVNIFHAKRTDAGIYECIATNEAGVDIQYVQVTVDEKRGDIGVYDQDGENGLYPGYVTSTSAPIYPPERPVYPPIVSNPNFKYPIQSSPFRVRLNDEVVLKCASEDNSMTTEWRRTDGRNLPSYSYTSRGDLIIRNVQYDSAGEYECITYDVRTRQPIVIVVADVIVEASPPKITFNPPMPIEVKSGENIIIYCNATGEQPLTVNWHLDAGTEWPRSVQISGNYLRFNYITREDAGRFYCSASNPFGNVTKVAEVVVSHSSAAPIDEDHYGLLKEGYEGDTVSLKCLENDLRYANRFEWTREGAELPGLSNKQDNTLILHNTRSEDSGRYICDVHYDDGTSSQNYVDLVVKPHRTVPVVPMPVPTLRLEPSRSYLRPGESIEVECTSSYGPRTKVTWQRAGGLPLPAHFEQIGNTLYIRNADLDDTGKYSCFSHTVEGQVYSSDYELNVENLEAPKEIMKKKIEHAEVGSTVVLRCNSQRAPATFQWSRQHGIFAPDVDINSEMLTLTDVQASDAGIYICTARYNGQTVEVPTTLVVTGGIPFFLQSPKSYMAFPKLDQAYAKFSFEITFRPEKANGLILYNGQRPRGGDYIALSLHNSVPQFRFSMGDRKGTLTAEKPIKLGEWHTIKVNRVRNSGFMIVDDQHPVVFPPNQRFQGLNLEENLYLGGVPNLELVAPTAVDVKEGFVGCISRLVLNERDVQLNKDALHVEGTTSCEPCADEPCKNDGTCLETQTEHGFTCVCNEGFTGKYCQVEGFQCTNDVCGTGRCEENDIGIECYCPLNRTGNVCQFIEHYNDGILSFKDGSYAAYEKLTSKKSIKFRIRPESDEDGVVLYAAESGKAYGDFLAVIIKNKHIELRYIVGGKLIPTILRARTPLKLNEWTDVSVGRSKSGLGYLQVGDEPQINEPKLGRAQTLFLKTLLYVGGYDKRLVLNRGVGVVKGFTGCITGLEVSGRAVNMIADIKDAANVYDCGHNFAEFSGDESDNLINDCRPGYTGANCETPIDYCEAHEPCQNGATCTNKGPMRYHCDCPLGYTGENCQHLLNLDLSVGFKGNGYLELDRGTISQGLSQGKTEIALMFSTKQPNGLLLWYGPNKGQPFNGEDFLALAVTDGFLEFSYRLDGEESYTKYTNERVDDDVRHVAIIKQNGNQFSLEVNHFTMYGETRPTGKTEIYLPGNIFLGGAPQLKNFTGDRYSQGFIGCIHIVEHLVKGPIQLGAKTISAVNAHSCSDDDEDAILGTEPPVV